MSKVKMQDVIVLLPGIMGSVLQKDGVDIWAPRPKTIIDSLFNLGKTLQQLKLDGDDPEAEDLGDGIQATRIVEIPHFVEKLLKVDGYTGISNAIQDYFDVKQGENFFKFPYDWRRDNRSSARKLEKFVDTQLKAWKESSGNKDAKVIFLAHSMGGLVSRYYLEKLGGWNHCKALFTFGTPHRGSVNAVDFLTHGKKVAFIELTEVLRSLTSVYQLLPIYPMLKVGNDYQRIAEATVELPGIEKEKAKDALAFHYEIRDSVKAQKKPYAIHPVVGTMQPTKQSAIYSNGLIEISHEMPKQAESILQSGDGTVPYVSAIPIELSDDYRETYIAEQHGSIQNNGRILDQVCQTIARLQVKTTLSNWQNPGITDITKEPAAIGLAVEDVYTTEQAVELRALLSNSEQDFGGLKARVRSVADDVVVARSEFTLKDGQWILQLDDLDTGVYQVEVRVKEVGSGGPEPVHDVFAVVN